MRTKLPQRTENPSKLSSWSHSVPRFARYSCSLYASHLVVSEISSLIAFFKSPTYRLASISTGKSIFFSPTTAQNSFTFSLRLCNKYTYQMLPLRIDQYLHFDILIFFVVEIVSIPSEYPLKNTISASGETYFSILFYRNASCQYHKFVSASLSTYSKYQEDKCK